MIAREYPVCGILEMCRPTELKVIPIVSEADSVRIPSAYMYYGQAIDKYPLALAVLRDVCQEISKRQRSGLVMPRLIVSIEDKTALINQCSDGEISGLLEYLSRQGEACGVELV